MGKKKVYVALLILVALAGILSPAFSLLSSINIANTGYVSPTTVTAASCSQSDVQNAINTVHAHGNGTVIIPAGMGIWNSFSVMGADGHLCAVQSYGGVNLIGAGSDVTILKATQDLPNTANFLCVDGSNGLPYRISGIMFSGFVYNESLGTNGLLLWNSQDFRVDHCWVANFSSIALYAEQDGSHINRGLVDHCNITQGYKNGNSTGTDWGYGASIVDRSTSAWSNLNTLLGQYYGAKDIIYVENCYFSQCRDGLGCAQNGYWVGRFNIINNTVPSAHGAADVHGFNWGRGCECYNNIFYGTSGNGQAIWLRGGESTVFNNTCYNMANGLGVLVSNEATSDSRTKVKNTYIWNTNMVDGGTAFQSAGSTPYYQENVDYFLYARPSYTPFTYPHPLTLSGS